MDEFNIIEGFKESPFRDVDMEFVDYANGFYGQPDKVPFSPSRSPGVDSIYGKDFFPETNGVTKAEIILATKIRMSMSIVGLPFNGDSTDREIVRDIMIAARGERS